MKIAALTSVYNEFFYLPLWLAHYGKMVDDLYVGDSGTDDGSIDRAKETYKFEVIKTKTTQPGYGHIYGTLVQTRTEVQNLMKDLLTRYDWVIYAHADEFIFPDPDKYTSLQDYIGKLEKDFVYCNGYDVVQDDSEAPLDPLKPILSQRKYWISTDSYSKPLLTRIPLEYVDGLHYLAGDPDFMQKRDLTLYLAHMARANKHLVPLRNPYRLSADPNSLDDFMKKESARREVIPERLKSCV